MLSKESISNLVAKVESTILSCKTTEHCKSATRYLNLFLNRTGDLHMYQSLRCSLKRKTKAILECQQEF
jgi:hypothetical protein